MDGMPELQEQIPAMSMDGRNAGIAGANSGDVHGWTECRVLWRSRRQRTLPTSLWVGPCMLPACMDTPHIPVVGPCMLPHAWTLPTSLWVELQEQIPAMSKGDASHALKSAFPESRKASTCA